MSEGEDLLAAYRPALLGELHRTVEALPFQHAALLRQQLASLGEAEDAMQPGTLGPALLCLLAAEAFAGGAAAALAPATALGLLGLSGAVFSSLGEDEAPGRLDGAAIGADAKRSPLLRAWGMPRSLNAGDAFFVAAQSVLLHPGEETAVTRLAALRLLDSAADQLSQSLQKGEASAAWGAGPALELAALYTGVRREAVAQLGPPGGAGQIDLQLAGLLPAARKRIETALRSLTEVNSH